MDDTTRSRTSQPTAERPHFGRERLVDILLRKHMTDAEYEHLKGCADCIEIVRLLLANPPRRHPS
jgi:hypothetical protein